jgi:hypothetical protein
MPTDPHNSPHEAKATGDIVEHPEPGSESVDVGYEVTDVNAGGIAVFLGGLFGFVIAFFFLCFFMGKMINNGLAKEDGPTDRFHTQNNIFAGAAANKNHEREELKSNYAMQQDELGKMTQAFPQPRLESDDGNQSTADLHAKEDLLLEHYSSTPGQPGIRIPIERAMELIVEKGLPVSAAAQPSQALSYEKAPSVTAPLTSGFARTGFELDTIEARKQKMEFEKPEPAAHAELKPIK